MELFRTTRWAAPWPRFYYTEPIDTQDVDIFVQVKEAASDLNILRPVYEYLRNHGYQAKAEHIYIEGFPVQFLPTFDPLTEEAVTQAQEFEPRALRTRIMRPKHLVALMLDTGRLKDICESTCFCNRMPSIENGCNTS